MTGIGRLRVFLVLVFTLWGTALFATPLLLVDMEDGQVLYSDDAGIPWHPASLTKLMTAMVAFIAIENGQFNLGSPVIISARALQAPPSKVGFPVDTAITMEDALNLLLVKSANDIAVAIAETVSGSVEAFVDEMNLTARTLGLTATHYVNPHGLHEVAQTTSARDLAVLAMNIRQNFPQYDPIFARSVVRVGNANLRSHNDLLTQFEGTTGMKTGYVCSAGLNLVATIERDGRRLLAVVLGASSGRERGERAAQMIVGALRGQLPGLGDTIAGVANQTGLAPVDMRPNMCGQHASAYVAQREAAFRFGLEGEPSFLTDNVAVRSHQVRALGRWRDVPVPLPRPASAPLLRPSLDATTISAELAFALPRPRPVLGTVN